MTADFARHSALGIQLRRWQVRLVFKPMAACRAAALRLAMSAAAALSIAGQTPNEIFRLTRQVLAMASHYGYQKQNLNEFLICGLKMAETVFQIRPVPFHTQ